MDSECATDLDCMLGQWCENARRLRRVLPSDWVVRRIVLVAAAPQPDDVFNTTQRVADMCGASVVYAKAQLLRAILRCKAFGTTGGMQERFLVNWQMFSWTRFDAVLKVDLDVEVAPLAEYDLLRAGAEWRAALLSFLGAPSAKFIALWKDVFAGSSTTSSPKFHWLLAYAHTCTI